ncbi:hypothetical protein SETIT_1G234500v2 [Setaria italica]|uniref:Leucine-rich repeat-containing N-terminal plant-type domain-containing protein n=2 Tax=Setaria italica TaxID=4555 RepID=A0A368PNU2_SETIT|nr:uncharacterized protein At4g06744 [Setaria italica]RCV07319.1 hypothetical protein SETIT_1G234500v2 [Setaria italica]
MANHHKRCPLTSAFVFILSYIVLIASVESARPGLSYNQHSPTYPQMHDFQNEQLFHAYFVIQSFKNTVTCDPRNITSTWTGPDICGKRSYVGFYCARKQGPGSNLTVTSAIFNGFGLCAPMLRGFLDQLPDLAHFQATSNNFGGDVPSLAGLTEVSNVDANGRRKQNREGSQSTTSIEIDNIGVTAKTMGDLVHAITHPFENSISAHLPKNNSSPRASFAPPSSLSPSTERLGFPKMNYLALANNKLTGPIPPSIAEAQDTLLEVLFLNNQLSGCLPNELGMLHKATVIDAGMNQLTGPIPASFSCLSSVEQLNLGGNRLYGQVPDALCKLAGPAGRLANLTLSGNYFTSVGPACAALIKDGVLDVKNNCIPGLANQRRPVECAVFHSHPKTCPAASAQVACPDAAAARAVAPPGERKVRDYSSYVTYATLHE